MSTAAIPTAVPPVIPTTLPAVPLLEGFMCHPDFASRFNAETYGSDDTKRGRSGLIGALVSWEIKQLNPNDLCPAALKAWTLFVIKKVFQFLDTVTGYTSYSTRLMQTWDSDHRFQTGVERNRAARMSIVNALGGTEACGQIPILQFESTDDQNVTNLPNTNVVDQRSVIAFDDRYFAQGQSILQGRDHAGRVFVVLRLEKTSTHDVIIATIYQAYRETFISASADTSDGSTWRMETNPRAIWRNSTENIVRMLQDLQTNGRIRSLELPTLPQGAASVIGPITSSDFAYAPKP